MKTSITDVVLKALRIGVGIYLVVRINKLIFGQERPFDDFTNRITYLV